MDDAQIRKKKMIETAGSGVWKLVFMFFQRNVQFDKIMRVQPNSMDDIKMIVISHTGLIVDNTVPPDFDMCISLASLLYVCFPFMA